VVSVIVGYRERNFVPATTVALRAAETRGQKSLNQLPRERMTDD
jgi:hypothetical protein